MKRAQEQMKRALQHTGKGALQFKETTHGQSPSTYEKSPTTNEKSPTTYGKRALQQLKRPGV